MRIVVVLENSPGQNDCIAKHGLCLYVETATQRFLLDSGTDGDTWKNAQKLGLDIAGLDFVCLSHGHYDHSGGLTEFIQKYPEVPIYLRANAGQGHWHGEERYIGINKAILSARELRFIQEEGITRIHDTVSVFAGVRGRRHWPEGNRELLMEEAETGNLLQDDFSHEQNLVLQTENGSLLLFGCAHNGILNILDRYHELYGDWPALVVSGFHMKKSAPYAEREMETICQTATELAKLPTIFYTGHCTGQPAYELMKPIMREQLHDLHTGMTIHFP